MNNILKQIHLIKQNMNKQIIKNKNHIEYIKIYWQIVYIYK